MLWMAGAACIASFALTSPFVLLDFSKFLTDFSFESNHLQAGHLSIILGRGWIHHLRFSLFYGLGGFFLATGLIGIFFLHRQHSRQAAVLLCFPIVYYLLIGRGYTVFSRYSLPLVPFLAITAACLLTVLRRRSFWLAGACALAALLPGLWTSLHSDQLLAQRDSRLLAADWLQENATDSSLIVFDTSAWAIPRLTMAQAAIPLFGEPDRTEIKPNLKRLYQQRADFYRQQRMPVFRQYMNQPAALLQAEPSSRPEWILVEQSALAGQHQTAPEMSDFLQAHYQLRTAIHAADVNRFGNHYDQQDAFYLPLAGFQGVQRPGPNMLIYQKKP